MNDTERTERWWKVSTDLRGYSERSVLFVILSRVHDIGITIKVCAYVRSADRLKQRSTRSVRVYDYIAGQKPIHGVWVISESNSKCVCVALPKEIHEQHRCSALWFRLRIILAHFAVVFHVQYVRSSQASMWVDVEGCRKLCVCLHESSMRRWHKPNRRRDTAMGHTNYCQSLCFSHVSNTLGHLRMHNICSGLGDAMIEWTCSENIEFKWKNVQPFRIHFVYDFDRKKDGDNSCTATTAMIATFMRATYFKNDITRNTESQ